MNRILSSAFMLGMLGATVHAQPYVYDPYGYGPGPYGPPPGYYYGPPPMVALSPVYPRPSWRVYTGPVYERRIRLVPDPELGENERVIEVGPNRANRPAPPPEDPFARDLIYNVQIQLAARQYAVGTPDGIAGPMTRSAIASFQRDHRLPMTGEVDDPLIAALGIDPGRLTPRPPASSTVPPPVNPAPPTQPPSHSPTPSTNPGASALPPPTPPSAATTAKYPAATPVSGKAGFVTSPHAPFAGMVDVRGIASGTLVKCPYTQKIFVVP